MTPKIRDAMHLCCDVNKVRVRARVRARVGARFRA